MIFSAIDFTEIPFRYLYLGLNFIVIFIALELCVLFFQNSRKKLKETIGQLNFSFGICFTCIAFNFTFKLIYQFLQFNPIIYQKLLYLSALGASICIVSIIEPTFRKNRFFTIIAIISFLTHLLINPYSIYVNIAIGFSAILVLFPVILFRYLLKNAGRTFRNRFLFLLLSILVLYTGITMNMEKNLDYFNSKYYLIAGYMIISLGLTGIYFSMKDTNVFIEVNWQSHVKELYIIQKSTLKPIYFQSLYKNNILAIQEEKKIDLFSGGVIGINQLLKEITTSNPSDNKRNQNLSLIQLENEYLMLEYEQDIIICILTDENLGSLRYFLRTIKDTWKKYYSTEVIDWSNVENDSFKILNKLINIELKNSTAKENPNKKEIIP